MDKEFLKFKNQYKITIILIVLLIFIGFTRPGKTSISIVERIVGDIASPIISVASRSALAVANTVENIVSIPSIIEENEALKEENIILNNENLRLNDIVARSEYLKNEYNLMENSSYDLVKANITGRALETPNLYLIDKGSASGIEVSDTVVVGVQSSENVAIGGLVGKVEIVGDNFSKISLINQGEIGISYTNIRTQEGGILDTVGEDILSGYTFDYNSDIVAEDRLYTSGLGEVYNSNIYIGRVSNVINDEENMKKNIEVDPVVDFNKLNTVLVIIGENNEENN